MLATKLILGMLYFYLVSEGLRRLVPPLAQKIRIYQLSAGSLITRQPTSLIWPLLRIGLLLVTFFLWGSILRMWMRSDQTSIWENQIVAISAVIIITADAVLFYFQSCSFRGAVRSSHLRPSDDRDVCGVLDVQQLHVNQAQRKHSKEKRS